MADWLWSMQVMRNFMKKHRKMKILSLFWYIWNEKRKKRWNLLWKLSKEIYTVFTRNKSFRRQSFAKKNLFSLFFIENKNKIISWKKKKNKKIYKAKMSQKLQQKKLVQKKKYLNRKFYVSKEFFVPITKTIKDTSEQIFKQLRPIKLIKEFLLNFTRKKYCFN